jgi:hypothetical protein
MAIDMEQYFPLIPHRHHDGVAPGSQPVSDVPCQQVSEEGAVKTAILNSVGIILVVAACLMVCVALNTVS